MSTPSSPWVVVALSSSAYAVSLRLLVGRDARFEELRLAIKIISGAHATGTTLLALYNLTASTWPMEPTSSPRITQHKTRSDLPNDATNPMIAGRSTLGNMLTAWECGYLIYDTFALLAESRLRQRDRHISTAVVSLLKGAPIFVVHHLVLVSSLLYLQTYVAAGREKGVWVIVAFLLMNTSNPLLHLRWWVRKRTGRPSQQLDIALALVFASSRFGSMYWILRKYATFHGLSVMHVSTRLRKECQTGTAVINLVNAVWLVGIMGQIVKQRRR